MLGIDQYNHRGQFASGFPSIAGHPNLKYHYLPDSDHTFGTEDARHDLLDTIPAWLLETIGRQTEATG